MTLQNRAEELKEEQLSLKQTINEKSTASILIGIFATGQQTSNSQSTIEEDPKVEALLKRPASEIPDASKIPELPALILPGQHASKKMKAQCQQSEPNVVGDPAQADDGIDYELLGKDRSQCSPAELDAIRRERNRMHAKRTRDRKRLYTEQLATMCQNLENENQLLHVHLHRMDASHVIPERVPIQAKSQRESPKRRKTESVHAQISTLLKAASHTEDYLHEISDSCSATGDERGV